MKILHINTFLKGGAGIAAARHSEAMSSFGIDSKLLSLDDGIGNNQITYPITEKQRERNRKLLYVLHKLTRLVVKPVAWHWSTFDYDISKIKEVNDADVIYIHWVNDFLSYNAIDYLLKTKKRVIWYMHDMWPITGGCHYSFECIGYENGCCCCPQMKAMKFLAHKQLQKKIREWSNYQNFYLAAPSKWLCECIKKSALFKSNKVVCCPNVINPKAFKPRNKQLVRNQLGLPINKKLILFSAMGVKNPYKGTEYLIKALEEIKSPDYEFLVLGKAVKEDFPVSIQKRIHVIGFVSNQDEMSMLYSAADLLVITSMADNFPNVVIEGMSCGLPVVGFATGGIKDQIKHQWNGYIVEPKDVDGIITGIDWVTTKADYEQLSRNARQYVLDNCSYQVVLKNHKQLLENL